MPPTEEDLAWFRSTFHPIPKAALPDDCVEYSIYLIDSTLDSAHDSELRIRLRDTQKYASELQKRWLKDYIWQRQGFALELVKEDGVSLLRGRTEFGDSVEDEWVVVWLLREISKKYSDLWIKASDTDGEFLLIEASGTIPAWLEPEVADNRVWIHDGGLTIIKPASAARSSKTTKEKLSFKDARAVIGTEPKRLMQSSIIQEEAFYRLRDYPNKIADNMHHAIFTLPRKIAYLLHQKPAYIAPAIEAFYLRDPIALKPLQTAKSSSGIRFPPDDLVTTSSLLPRVGFAQLRSQDFPAPALWKSRLPSKTARKISLHAEAGMKLSCGFEMLLSDPHYQDKPVVREMKMLLDDLDFGDEQLPTDEEVKSWSMREDDESWLDIDFDDLETELVGRGTALKNGKKAEFGDKATQDNLRRIVKQFEDFMNDDKAGPDGAGLFDEDSGDDLDDVNVSDEDDLDDVGEDKDASFGEDDFTRMMREMMGIPADVMNEMMSGEMPGIATSSSQDVTRAEPSSNAQTGHVEEHYSSDSESDGEDLETVMQQMEAELKGSGALGLDASTGKVGATSGAVKGKQSASVLDDVQSDDSEEDVENDIDVNLARNLLESFKSQAGLAGPGGNLMGIMGMELPRDEGDGEGRLQNEQ